MEQYRREFGAHIKKLRKEKKWSQDEMAEKSGLTPAYLSAVERGIANPRLDTIKKLATGFGIPTSELFAFERKDSSISDFKARIMQLVQDTDDQASVDSLCHTIISTFLNR